MTQHIVTRVLCVVALATFSQAASAASIGIFSTQDASSCNLTTPSGSVGSAYVVATIAPGEYCGGIHGAEFRIVGAPDAWVITASPAPGANLVLGNPLTTGVNIGFPVLCAGPRVLLFTLSIQPMGPVDLALLRVTKHTNPSGPLYQCPTVTPSCLDWFRDCVSGGGMYVNGPECSVGVAGRSWTSVKALYRNP